MYELRFDASVEVIVGASFCDNDDTTADDRGDIGVAVAAAFDADEDNNADDCDSLSGIDFVARERLSPLIGNFVDVVVLVVDAFVDGTCASAAAIDVFAAECNVDVAVVEVVEVVEVVGCVDG